MQASRNVEVRKEFENNQVTHSARHYWVTIAEWLDAHGYARVLDIAESLPITRGSASIMFDGLERRQLARSCGR